MESLSEINSFNTNNGLESLGAFGTGASSILYAGQQLTPNTSIKSDNGVFTFGMGGDGNLWVVDNVRNIVLLNFNIANRGVIKAIMQWDGNFVAYNASNQAIWNSGPKGAGSYIIIQGDGNLVIYNNGTVKWQSHTYQNATLVTQEAHQAIINSITPISLSNVAQWSNLFQSGQLTNSEKQTLEDFQAAAVKTIVTSGPITMKVGISPDIAEQNNVAMQKIQQNPSFMAYSNLLTLGAAIETIINMLMVQQDHDGNFRPKYWAVPNLLNSFGNVMLSNEDSQTKIFTTIDSYINQINSTNLSSMTILQKKQILYYLMYPYVYFANQTINMSPFRQTGHSGHQNWIQCDWTDDYTYAILNKIIPIIQRLGFTNLYSKMAGLVTTFWGSSYGNSTGGKFPAEIGFRKVIDESYKSQADAAGKNSSVISQVDNVFASIGTEIWHGFVMPAIGFAVLGIMLSGFMGITFIIEIFDPKLHLNAKIFAWIGHMFQGFPFIGQFIDDLLTALGKWLDHMALQITKIFSPDVNPNKARDEEEYKILIASTDNELINYEKNVQAITKILNDWDSDQRDDLKSGLIVNINNRSNSKIIWASLEVIDKQLLGVE